MRLNLFNSITARLQLARKAKTKKPIEDIESIVQQALNQVLGSQHKKYKPNERLALNESQCQQLAKILEREFAITIPAQTKCNLKDTEPAVLVRYIVHRTSNIDDV